jgi:hypothetical protein
VQAIRDEVASWNGPGIDPAHGCTAVGEVFGRDAVYVADGGNTSLSAALSLPSTPPCSLPPYNRPSDLPPCWRDCRGA